MRDEQLDWLATGLPPGKPALLVLHHYPLPVAPFRWNSGNVEVLMEIPEKDRAKLWNAARAAGVRLVLCGHVHRARLEWHDGIAVGLQGQSGAAWAGRTIGWYERVRAGRPDGGRADGLVGGWSDWTDVGRSAESE